MATLETNPLPYILLFSVVDLNYPYCVADSVCQVGQRQTKDEEDDRCVPQAGRQLGARSPMQQTPASVNPWARPNKKSNTTAFLSFVTKYKFN